MPPANSPSETPAFSSSVTSSYLQQLEAISSPVPNLAATLINPPEVDDAHDENVSFLRTRIRLSPDSSSSSRARRRRPPYPPEGDLDSMDTEDQRNPQLEGNRRFPIIRRPRDGSNIVPDYEGRMSNVRSLYGWAPGSDEEDEDETMRDSSSNNIWFGRGSDRETLRNSAILRTLRREGVGRMLPPFGGDPSEGSGLSALRYGESSLSTEALLQSVRRQSRFSRSRTLQNYILERERSGGQEPEDRDRERSSTSRTFRFIPSSRNLPSNDIRVRLNAHRQLYSEHPPSARLKEAIKYLERVRFSNSYEESISSAAEGGFIQFDYFTCNEDDLILDTSSIAPPAECSWLRPGSVFTGSQRAANSVGSQMLSHRILGPPNEPVIVNGSETSRISVYTSSGRRYWASNLYQPITANSKDEHWPVKVTIHSVDYSTMTLSGTMEAYNIPDKTSPARDAHIITFLEGEIIDFNTHTLETKSFKADAEIDSTYWRELQPFKNLTDDEMIKNLVSKRWVTEELTKGWILMRWKERCFITPTDARQGLTISGFYYISLRRDTGEIDGLYYDPGSSPYQQLSLKPEREKMVFPAYGFR
ncbi:hypothetical protein VTN77DRAFT_80 [Rasamsonia byssochlamydoides]|uniref:uncharacterized protein n=1 Tax=Rasamsonia byssochlamydoides TaxID=89139 RepID=UPI003744923C